MTHLPDDLLKIRRSLLSLGVLVATRLQRVVWALASNDLESAREVRHGDREVDTMEIDIEKHCVEVLALQQPVARDLRFVLAVLRINNELERIGDLAKGIAKRLLHLQKLGYLSLPPILGTMAQAVQGQVNDVLKAFADEDAALATRIRRHDREIDELQRAILDWAHAEILAHGGATEAAIDIMSIARGLERVGDICTNIAEDVVYLVEGEVVRHTEV